MSGASSSAAEWSTRLIPARPVERPPLRPDDPRLAEVIECWDGDPVALRPGRAVLVGFPQDEGVRRNGGRPGAAQAPGEVRQYLARLAPWDPDSDTDLSLDPPLDLGNVRLVGDLEATQVALADVVAAVLQARATPVVLGGGHETVHGVYCGHVAAGRPVGVVNIDAHLDVRPTIDGRGHSGSPFRQMMEHATHPLRGERYVCLGAQPGSVGRWHWEYVRDRGCVVHWCDEVRGSLVETLAREVERVAADGYPVHLTIDADVVRTADVPGVSAPNPAGLSGSEVIAAARWAGRSPHVAGLDLVEINPRLDRDGQSARWGALVVWNFLVGLAARRGI